MDQSQAEPRAAQATDRHDVERIADAIRGAVADRRLAEVIVRRVAMMAADGMISRPLLKEQLEYIAQGRRAGTIKKPGAYFVACAKDLFAKAGIPWSTV